MTRHTNRFRSSQIKKITNSFETEFEALILYNTFLTEQKPSYKKDIRHASNWIYDEHKDE
ncbi:hypothetical protein [Peribacillus butanolivorans]|uniref:hypothetical protein n=1 Tax=Peribacillus butanolivorans TaxID=421767 RepID=UPI00366B06B2